MVDRMSRAGQFFEQGHSYFRSGDYYRALEQFEQGKLVAAECSWNFFATSMTLMQMILEGVFPEDQITMALRRAQKNLQACLLISPTEPDYLAAMTLFQEFTRKANL